MFKPKPGFPQSPLLVTLDMPVGHHFETLERELYLGSVLQPRRESWLKAWHVEGEFRETAGYAVAPGVESVWGRVLVSYYSYCIYVSFKKLLTASFRLVAS